MAKINSITATANGGLALIGGWYVYVTLPYVYVAPIISGGSCSLALNPILSYGGPGECNYDNSYKTCISGKTIEDTMGDQGRPCLWYCGAFLTAPGSPRPMAEAAQELPAQGCLHERFGRAALALTPWGVVQLP